MVALVKNERGGRAVEGEGAYEISLLNELREM